MCVFLFRDCINVFQVPNFGITSKRIVMLAIVLVIAVVFPPYKAVKKGRKGKSQFIGLPRRTDLEIASRNLNSFVHVDNENDILLLY